MKTEVIQIHKTTAMTYDTHMGDVGRVTCSDRERELSSIWWQIYSCWNDIDLNL